jgi:hypothetical protein
MFEQQAAHCAGCGSGRVEQGGLRFRSTRPASVLGSFARPDEQHFTGLMTRTASVARAELRGVRAFVLALYPDGARYGDHCDAPYFIAQLLISAYVQW